MIIKNEDLMLRIDIKTKDPIKVLKALIQNKNLSIRQLSLLSNINYKTLFDILNKEIKITKNTSEKLANILDVKPHLLYKLRLEQDIKQIKKEIAKLDT